MDSMGTLIVVIIEDLDATRQALSALCSLQKSGQYPLDAIAVYKDIDGTLKSYTVSDDCVAKPASGAINPASGIVDVEALSTDAGFIATLLHNLTPGRAALLAIAGDHDDDYATLMTVMLLLSQTKVPPPGHANVQPMRAQEQYFQAKIMAYQAAVANLDLLQADSDATEVDVAYQAVDDAYLDLRHLLTFEPEIAAYAD
jgi:hypothetical protein